MIDTNTDDVFSPRSKLNLLVGKKKNNKNRFVGGKETCEGIFPFGPVLKLNPILLTIKTYRYTISHNYLKGYYGSFTSLERYTNLGICLDSSGVINSDLKSNGTRDMNMSQSDNGNS